MVHVVVRTVMDLSMPMAVLADLMMMVPAPRVVVVELAAEMISLITDTL